MWIIVSRTLTSSRVSARLVDLPSCFDHHLSNLRVETRPTPSSFLAVCYPLVARPHRRLRTIPRSLRKTAKHDSGGTLRTAQAPARGPSQALGLSRPDLRGNMVMSSAMAHSPPCVYAYVCDCVLLLLSSSSSSSSVIANSSVQCLRAFHNLDSQAGLCLGSTTKRRKKHRCRFGWSMCRVSSGPLPVPHFSKTVGTRINGSSGRGMSCIRR